MPDHDLMQTFPPIGDDAVTLENWRTPPHNRWAYQHVSELVPSAQIWRGSGPVWELPRASLDLSDISYTDHAGTPETVAAFLDTHQTDGICVLRRGEIVMEHYRNGLQAHRPHILMSVSKSITALVIGILVEQGKLDPAAGITHLIPEVEGSAFGDCTLQHLLDMTVGVDFTEDYLAAAGLITEYREVSNWKPPSDPANPGDLRSWLCTLKKDGEHGAAFHYVSPCTDLLGWIIERAAGRPYAEVVSELLWRPMGAEFDGYVTVDRLGAPRAAGGICLTLRDLARVGQMMLENGQANGRQVVPQSWVADSRFNGDTAAWAAGEGAAANPHGSYRNKWWIMGDGHSAYTGIGVFGQYLWIDPVASLVIAKFASEPLPTDDNVSLDTARCFQAIGLALA
ncbi:MAG: serine hydrolase [Rhodospirillaceae bacterium]|nr:serine hydrolase [Rhodospirillaceae bacterium]|tara:strand:+ start:19843 stop:21033 length:1191 start_codon:yes stop_codon:yes gene_type:complete